MTTVEGAVVNRELAGILVLVPPDPPPPPQAASNAKHTKEKRNFKYFTGLSSKYQRTDARSETIFGVMNTNISCLLEDLVVVLNTLPITGISPSKGTLVKLSDSVS